MEMMRWRITYECDGDRVVLEYNAPNGWEDLVGYGILWGRDLDQHGATSDIIPVGQATYQDRANVLVIEGD